MVSFFVLSSPVPDFFSGTPEEPLECCLPEAAAASWSFETILAQVLRPMKSRPIGLPTQAEAPEAAVAVPPVPVLGEDAPASVLAGAALAPTAGAGEALAPAAGGVLPPLVPSAGTAPEGLSCWDGTAGAGVGCFVAGASRGAATAGLSPAVGSSATFGAGLLGGAPAAVTLPLSPPEGLPVPGRPGSAMTGSSLMLDHNCRRSGAAAGALGVARP
mmetsp:Transcript_104096/g.222382  ORF Transcript_104096/g.222382 Transcript_104096/m.222382 type:complete len:216 (+) Transcript_104096:193-840(+)